MDTIKIDGRVVTPTPREGERNRYSPPNELIIDGVAVSFFDASSRTVFDFDDRRVLKVGLEDYQNACEWEMWQELQGTPAEPHLAKCYAYVEGEMPNGSSISFLLQERLTDEQPSVDDEDYQQAVLDCLRVIYIGTVPHDDDLSDYELGDDGVHQWKRDKNGVVKCHDYALWGDC
jgi:hypothetical protein